MIYLILFLEFFKIGLFTFGGGYAMIPLFKEVVLRYNWLTLDNFYNFLGICEATPGPIAINMATFIGSSQAGLLGSIMATLGVVLPSFIIILLVATILKSFIKNKYVQRFLDGVKPVVIGLITSTGILLVLKAIGLSGTTFTFDVVSTISLVVLGLYYVIKQYILKKKVNNIAFIVLSAIVGLIIAMLFGI